MYRTTDDTEALLCSVWRTNMLDYIGSEMIVAEGSPEPSWAPGKVAYSDEIRGTLNHRLDRPVEPKSVETYRKRDWSVRACPLPLS